jgi:uncharacterized membrane protein (UPF0127 family)
MRKSALAGGLAMAVASAGAVGCEHRIEEPPPPARPVPAPEASAPERPSAAPPAASSAPACVKPTPATASREVTGPVPAPGCPADPGHPELPRGKVMFHGATGAKKSVDVEIAKTDPDRQRGLMYRTSMPENDGMLFIFERQRKLSFWMRNTCIPLDMIFVAEDGTIVKIEENVPTLTDQTFPSECPAKYVVEMNAGWCRKNGVAAGQRLDVFL